MEKEVLHTAFDKIHAIAETESTNKAFEHIQSLGIKTRPANVPPPKPMLNHSEPLILQLVNTTPYPINNLMIFGANSNYVGQQGLFYCTAFRGGPPLNQGTVYIFDNGNNLIGSATMSNLQFINNIDGQYSFTLSLISGTLTNAVYIQNSPIAGAGADFTLKSVVAASTIISSNIADVSYTEMLANSQAKPYNIGQVMMISNSPGQVEQPLQYQYKTDTGGVTEYTIAPVLDPYQGQADRSVTDQSITVDGFASLTLSQLNANSTMTMYMYLMNRFSPTGVVAGQPVAPTDYSDPSLIKYLNK